jgi:hypothetical protein
MGFASHLSDVKVILGVPRDLEERLGGRGREDGGRGG